MSDWLQISLSHLERFYPPKPGKHRLGNGTRIDYLIYSEFVVRSTAWKQTKTSEIMGRNKTSTGKKEGGTQNAHPNTDWVKIVSVFSFNTF